MHRKCPQKPAPRGFAGAGGNSRWKERRRAVEGFDFQAQAGVVASLGRVATHEAVLVGLVLFADAAQGDPLAELAADPGVGLWVSMTPGWLWLRRSLLELMVTCTRLPVSVAVT